jgi:natural product biosynthesis luciferase-like monooxygenase protein
VTSISFDISVLELFWTLTRAFTVALHSEVPEPATDLARQDVGPSLSLFYFAAAPPESQASAKAPDTYRLLMEGARFADTHGFEAVWTPERHFHAFGGIYPNPAVAGAAVAAVTQRIAVRAGSIVLPLHDPIRVAEDWSVIDNLSGGRVGIAVASGWMPEDFVLAPHAFERRKQIMLEHIDTIARLWRGEKVARPKADGTMAEIGTLPRPVQPALPVWLTAAKNPETFEIAGTRGANVLTHLLGMSVEEMAENIATYRRAWTKAGHAGSGRVTLMLHTFVGPDDQSVRDAVREPMKRYLASAVDIVRAAEWNFPTLVARGEGGMAASKKRLTAADLGPEDLDAVLEHAFDRYYGSSGLFGTPDRCAEFARRLKALGVDELACLVDFGVDTDAVLASLPHLAEVGAKLGAARPAEPVSVASDIVRHGATHFQCTPSMAAMLLADDDGRHALSGLRAMLVGGEALPPDMAEALVATVSGPVLNMYGPTETTVWSTSAELHPAMPFVPLGTPLAGECIDVVDAAGQSLPALVAGELIIGGIGVSDGYWRRPELTAERFVIRTTASGASRWYRTGDLARRHPSGDLEYLGRIDQQVKIRGHRIELGEIEATLASSPEVAQVAVVARKAAGGTAELAAFVVPAPGATPKPATLLGEVARLLPQIMVPAALTILDRLPQTANGKIDRTALANRTTTPSRPAAVPSAGATGGRPAPPASGTPATADDGEARIAHVWSRLLGRAEIAHTDNFFDLGGHSLLAVELHRTLVSELSLDLKLTDIFRYPTVAALARHASRSAPPEKVASVAGQDRARMRLEMTRRARTRSGSGPASPGGADV